MTCTIDSLVTGYRSFFNQHFAGNHGTYAHLAAGQAPKVLFIACSDSRVDPAILTGAKPGELFVVRHIANIVPPYASCNDHHVSAALEFGICTLHIPHIIVCGHSQCGGISALFQQQSAHQATRVQKWMAHALPAYKATIQQHPDAPQATQITQCAQQSLHYSKKNLLSYPYIAKRVLAHQLCLHLWYFEIASGVLTAFDPDKKAFVGL